MHCTHSRFCPRRAAGTTRLCWELALAEGASRVPPTGVTATPTHLWIVGEQYALCLVRLVVRPPRAAPQTAREDHEVVQQHVHLRRPPLRRLAVVPHLDQAGERNNTTKQVWYVSGDGAGTARVGCTSPSTTMRRVAATRSTESLRAPGPDKHPTQTTTRGGGGCELKSVSSPTHPRASPSGEPEGRGAGAGATSQ
jgi:hypothetical protein